VTLLLGANHKARERSRAFCFCMQEHFSDPFGVICRSSIPIFPYNGCVVIAVVAILLDDNRLITIAVAIPVVVRTDRYANRPDPDANVFCSGG
jgi:hypothetical protein